MINNLVSRRGASPVAPATGSGRVIPARVRPQTSQTYYHRNQQYSIVGLTNAAGTLVERYTYSAYGTLGIYAANGTVRSSSTYANRYTYTGREWDGDLRLYHFRARWYDPSTGGFISRDPLGYVDGMNLYRGYFGVSTTDPFGLSPVNVACWVAGCGGCLACLGPGAVACYAYSKDSAQFVSCYEYYLDILPTWHKWCCATACGACGVCIAKNAIGPKGTKPQAQPKPNASNPNTEGYYGGGPTYHLL